MGSLTQRICLLLLLGSPAYALDSINLELDSLEKAGVSLTGIQLSMQEANAQQPGFLLSLAQIKLPGFEGDIAARLSCPGAELQARTLKCSNGSIEISLPDAEILTGSFHFNLLLPRFSGEFSVLLQTPWGDLGADYLANEGQAWKSNITLENFDLASLAATLAANLSIFRQYQLLAGRLQASARLSGTAFEVDELSVQTALEELSVDGSSIMDKVALSIDSELQRVKQGWQFRQKLRVDSGEMYLQPGISLLGDQPGFYIDASSSVLDFDWRGSWSSTDRILQLDSFNYQHPGVMELSGSSRLVINQGSSISSLSLVSKIDDLGLTYPVYIQPLLLKTNFNDLEVSGAIQLELDYRDDELRSLGLVIREVYIDDDEGRFSISNLNSQLNLGKEKTLMQSLLAWEGMSFYRLDLGPGDILFESRGNDIRVLAWENVSILDGALIIDEFSLENIASRDFSLSIGGRLQPISMEMLTHAMGWTVFPGELSGEISGLKYHRNRVELEGDIEFSLFGGKLNIRDLQVDDIFSSYSVLTTELSVERLDLEQMTDVFAFGKIEGSLSGSINKLRLEDWRPSYFEAEFATPLDDDVPHRISQKALENLNELGGGLSGTLSRGFLRFLPAYSYGRLGISCRLVNGICELGGVEDYGESFAILTKGGLFPPWVEVRGAGRAIKWDDLLDGLKQIAEGEVAIE